MNKDQLILVGKKLRLARESCRLGRDEVAGALGCVKSTILRWEHGDRLPKERDLWILSKIYQVSKEWILYPEEKVKPELGGEIPPPSKLRREVALSYIQKLNSGLPLGSPQVMASGTNAGESANFLDEVTHRMMGQREHGPSIASLDRCLILEEIAGRIKVVLAARPELESLPGIEPSVYSAMQTGTVIPTTTALMLLAKHAGVKPEWFLTGQETSI